MHYQDASMAFKAVCSIVCQENSNDTIIRHDIIQPEQLFCPLSSIHIITMIFSRWIVTIRQHGPKGKRPFAHFHCLSSIARHLFDKYSIFFSCPCFVTTYSQWQTVPTTEGVDDLHFIYIIGEAYFVIHSCGFDPLHGYGWLLVVNSSRQYCYYCCCHW